MANGSVEFKANANGLVVVFDKHETFESIYEQISKKLESGGFFFQTRYLATSYKGRKLSAAEEGAISRMMAEKTGARTVLFEIDKAFERELRRSGSILDDEGPDDEGAYGSDAESGYADGPYDGRGTESGYADDPYGVRGTDAYSVGGADVPQADILRADEPAHHRETVYRRRYEPVDLDECITKYHRGTLRSGRLISYDGNVVVIGDVNPGAEVEATGNIIILGNVRGIVHAGAGGNKEASIIALNFAPTQLRVADIITRRQVKRGRGNAGINPEIAYINNDMIVFEPLHHHVP